MGHAYDYKTFEEKTSFKKMYAHSCGFAFENVDRGENPTGSYDNRWLEHKEILDSKEEAKIFLDSKGVYVDGCVRFREAPKLSAKIRNIEERIKSTREKKEKFNETHNVTSRKSKFIGCEKCGSKIAREYIRGNECPVCRTDLRAEYIIEKLNSYDEKIRELEKEYRSEVKKNNQKKGKIYWLVKTEIHR